MSSKEEESGGMFTYAVGKTFQINSDKKTGLLQQICTPLSTQKNRGFHSFHAVCAVVTLGVGGWQ
jgi:hypothetical protein